MAGKKRPTSSSPSSPAPSLHSSAAPQTQRAQQPILQPKRIHRPPKPLPLLKRWWLFYEGSFAGSMLETWEKILLHSVLLALFALFYIACSRYLPARVNLAWSRVQWYLFGEGTPVEKAVKGI